MHKIDRSTVQPPGCLETHDYRTQSWSNLAPECKRTIRSTLVQMQGKPGVTIPGENEYDLLCAYCEGRILHEGHIEHFRRKNEEHFPQLTFKWQNLFLACGSREHCGHYKDRPGAPAYNPDNLIKPDEHNPDQYLYFHSSGEVRPRSNLSADKEIRATETIRVFGLDSAALTGHRCQALKIYKRKIIEDLDILASWPEQEREQYLADEIEATRWEPYTTTIKHFLQRN